MPKRILQLWAKNKQILHNQIISYYYPDKVESYKLSPYLLKEYKNRSELEKHEPTPSPYEVELWSDLFKDKK